MESKSGNALVSLYLASTPGTLMASYFEFLAKTIHLPATAPTLAVLSLAALAAGQLHDRLASPVQGHTSSPDRDRSTPRPAPPAANLSPTAQGISPEASDNLNSGFAADFSPEAMLEAFEQASVLPNLGIPLPAPADSLQPKAQASPAPITPAIVPQLVQAAVSQSLGYQELVDQNDRQEAQSVATLSQWIEDSGQESDLANHWSRPYVTVLAEMGLVKGLPNGNFEPDRPITRAELADLLQRALPQSSDTSLHRESESTTFSDVPAQHWAYRSIDRAYRMGFFPDTEATGFFRPDRPASRLVTWGAIVAGLDLPHSRQHGELMQAWQSSLGGGANSLGGDTSSGVESTVAELHQPISRAETIALLYHALSLADPDLGEKLAQAESVFKSSSPSQSFIEAKSQDETNPLPSSVPVNPSLENPKTIALSESPTIPIEDPEPALSVETSPDQTTEALNPQLNPPILVAAVGGDPMLEPLLTPLPPPLNPTSIDRANAERISPEFTPPSPVTLAQAANVSGTIAPGNEPLAAVDVDETYTLGAGDRIFVEVFGLPQYSQEYQILVDGSLNLPRAGRMVVEGMSLAEAEALIYARYARYYRQPATSVILVNPRSLQIAVTGAVNRPGVYRLSPEDGSQFPSVTQAIQEAGGIGAKADLRKIQVQRSQRDGTRQNLGVNLWDLLQSGNLSQDISLRDGDRLLVPEAEALTPEELSRITSANFSPETIEVSVVGSATESPGTLQVSPNTPLSQVVLATGGFNDRQERRTVSLIRLHPNGTVEQRSIEVSISGEVNEQTNPILQHQDVVILDRSKGAAAREKVTGFLGNILRVLPFFRLF